MLSEGDLDVVFCADFVVSAAARGTFCLALRPRPTFIGGGVAQTGRRSSPMSHTGFRGFSAKDLCHNDMHDEQLFFAVVWFQTREKVV